MKYGEGVTGRFLSRVSQGAPGECWEYQGSGAGKYGHCQMYVDGKRVYVHRIAWVLANGSIPEGQYVLHHCDNPPCCNPGHLFLGTYKDNALDASAKGRLRPPRGDEHWTRKHPERIPRGERHFSRTKPECVPRGDRNGSRKHPERLARGSRQGSALLKEWQIPHIRTLLSIGVKHDEIAEAYEVSRPTVSRIARGETWQHVPGLLR